MKLFQYIQIEKNEKVSSVQMYLERVGIVKQTRPERSFIMHFHPMRKQGWNHLKALRDNLLCLLPGREFSVWELSKQAILFSESNAVFGWPSYGSQGLYGGGKSAPPSIRMYSNPQLYPLDLTNNSNTENNIRSKT